MDIDVSLIFKGWDAPYISRQDLCKVSGNLLNPRTLRNLDALGRGIPGKFLVSPKRAAYPIQNVIKWLEDRIDKLNSQSDTANEDRAEVTNV